MLILCFIIMALLPYLICGINTAIIVTKIKSGKDIRTLGSGNAGLTNVLRTQEKTAALLVLLGDIAKGVIAVIAVKLVFFYLAGIDTASYANGYNFIPYATGLAACLGHDFPLYYGFKGGKGILVSISVFFAVDWLSALLLVAIFALFVALTRYVSLGSIISSAVYPVIVLILSLWRENASVWLNVVFSLLNGILLVFMHRKNISRLLSGTEKKLGQKEM